MSSRSLGRRSICRNFSYEFFWTSIRFGIGIEVLILEKSTLSGARPVSDIGFGKLHNKRHKILRGRGVHRLPYLDNSGAENNDGWPVCRSMIFSRTEIAGRTEPPAKIRLRELVSITRTNGRERNAAAGGGTGTRVALARRRKKPLPAVLVGLQLNCQDFSATVTNPGVIPVATNANLRL